MDIAIDNLSGENKIPMKRKNSEISVKRKDDILSDIDDAVMQQDTAQGEKNLDTPLSDEKIHKASTEVFRLTKTGVFHQSANLASGVFRLTRPAMMKSTENPKTSECPFPIETFSSQSTSNTQFNNSEKGVSEGKKTQRRVVKEKRSTYRNKKIMMSSNNHNAILLPRPISHQAKSGTNIQRIPVLNNTYFHLPKNAPIDAQNSFVNPILNDLNSKSMLSESVCNGNQKMTTTMSNDCANVIKSDHNDFNNNSRVRNTQKNTIVKEAEVEDCPTFDRNYIDTSKFNADVEVHEDNMVQASSIQIKENKTESVPQNILSTRQCHEGKGTYNKFKDDQQNLESLELTQVKDKANIKESCAYLKSKDTSDQGSKEIVSKQSVTSPGRKTRKRTYKDTKHTDNHKTVIEETEIVKKSYVVSDKCANKRTAKTNSETDSKPFHKNSKVYHDIETRYMRNDLTGSTSFEKVFEDKCDIINKVESEKLSEVKNHHLLRLSEKEREYLRSKCYLENDLVSDVRRRFENSADNKIEAAKSTNDFIKSGRGIQLSENPTKETIHITNSNSGSSEILGNEDSDGVETSSYTTTRKDRDNNLTTKEKPTSRQIEKEHQEKSQFVDHYHSLICLKQPVVRLQNLECLALAKKQSTDDKKPEKQQNVVMNKNFLNSSSAPRKVFYVVNSNAFTKQDKSKNKTSVASCTKNNASVSSMTGTTSPKEIHTNKIFSMSVTEGSSSHSKTIQKTVPTVTLNTDIPAEQHYDSKLIKRGVKYQTSQQKTYSNKLTVKELLEAKRDEDKSRSAISRLITDKEKHSVSLPVQLCERTTNGQTDETKIAKSLSMKTNDSGNTMNVVATNTGVSSSSILHDVQQTVYQNVIPVQSVRTIHIVNPHVIVPSSVHQQACIAPKSNISLPVNSLKKTEKVTLQKVNSSDDKRNVVTFSDNEDKKRAYFKIGNQTVIVKRSEDSLCSRRKTLPVPKSKRTIADDYKRRRRRSRDRFTQKMHRKTFESNVKKMIKESDKTVFKMMYALDLVPVKILEQISAAERESKSGTNTPKKNSVRQHDNVDNKMKEECSIQTAEREQRINGNKGSESMANILQIIKLEDETITVNFEQIKVCHGKPGSADNNISSASFGFRCRLNFSASGAIEEMYVENLYQGLFLVKNADGDKVKLANKKKMYTCLVPYPPCVNVIPCGSLSIAVGDVYQEQQKSQFLLKDMDVQTLLDQFLQPITPKNNINECFDERYSSITDKSMTPRCSSPMFYSQEMKNTFDDFIEEGTISSEYTKLYFSRRCETNLTKLDLQTTRFSERAMALKIKQNELFESCRRLKSESTTKIGSKKKREKRLLMTSATCRMETLKSKDEEGMNILSNPLDVSNAEKYSETQSKETTDGNNE